MSHNGEINTRQGNFNWMHAREGVLESDLFKTARSHWLLAIRVKQIKN
jgi:glutamate synthase (NADPH/NADH) large chain